MSEQDEVLDRGYDAALLRRLLTYLRPYRGLTRARGCCFFWPARGWRWSARPSPSARSISPFLTTMLALLGSLAGIFLAALLVDFGVEYGQTLLTA